MSARPQGAQPAPFLRKTYEIVSDPQYAEIVSWNASGESFVVWKPSEFASEVLPKHFKHSNFSSFVRQLNTYGFRKINSDRWEFASEGFRRNRRDLLSGIQRRKPQSQTGNNTEVITMDSLPVDMGRHDDVLMEGSSQVQQPFSAVDTVREPQFEQAMDEYLKSSRRILSVVEPRHDSSGASGSGAAAERHGHKRARPMDTSVADTGQSLDGSSDTNNTSKVDGVCRPVAHSMPNSAHAMFNHLASELGKMQQLSEDFKNLKEQNEQLHRSFTALQQQQQQSNMQMDMQWQQLRDQHCHLAANQVAGQYRSQQMDMQRQMGMQDYNMSAMQDMQRRHVMQSLMQQQHEASECNAELEAMVVRQEERHALVMERNRALESQVHGLQQQLQALRSATTSDSASLSSEPSAAQDISASQPMQSANK